MWKTTKAFNKSSPFSLHFCWCWGVLQVAFIFTIPSAFSWLCEKLHKLGHRLFLKSKFNVSCCEKHAPIIVTSKFHREWPRYSLGHVIVLFSTL
jgi:hypothetical protein